MAYSTVNAVHVTKGNQYVIATNGEGILFFNPTTQQVKQLKISNGMPSDIVQGILALDERNIWASTTKGLTQLFISDTDTIIKIFDQKDGLASTEFNYGSFAKLNDNIFAFGGIDGVSIFNPKKIKSQNDQPIVVFDEFKLFK